MTKKPVKLIDIFAMEIDRLPEIRERLPIDYAILLDDLRHRIANRTGTYQELVDKIRGYVKTLPSKGRPKGKITPSYLLKVELGKRVPKIELLVILSEGVNK